MNLYRACTQSYVIDEAFSYLEFVSKPWAGLFVRFNANNHILYTILAHLSSLGLGASEWSLRLPSVLGGAVYLYACYRICFRSFGGKLWSLLVFLLLTVHPFILDFLSAARGYGLALAFLLSTCAFLLPRLQRGSLPVTAVAGAAMGLCVAANLTMLVPVLSVAAGWVAVRLAQRQFSWTWFWNSLTVPAIVTAFVIVVLPLASAQPGEFYYGARNWTESVGAMTEVSFLYRRDGLAALPAAQSLLRLCHQMAPRCFIALSAAMALAAPFSLIRLRRTAKEVDVRSRGDALTAERDGRLAFFAVTWLGLLMINTILHRLLHVPLPLYRTSIYFLPLATLSAASLADRFRLARWPRLAFDAVAVLLILALAVQASVTYYTEWRFDAGTKKISQMIEREIPHKEVLRVRASWVLEATLNFYRTVHHLNWLPLDRSNPDQPADAFVLVEADQALVAKRNLRVLYRDPVSKAVLAVPAQPVNHTTNE